MEEEDARVGESTVRNLVGRLRTEIGADRCQVMVPQTHPAALEAEVDFGEFTASIAGRVMKLYMFCMRLSHSGKPFHFAYDETQESFLDGHVRAFEAFGGYVGVNPQGDCRDGNDGVPRRAGSPMCWSPCLVRSDPRDGSPVEVRLGDPLVDGYLEFVAARCRPNTVLATAYDLKVFFEVVGKEPERVSTADVFAFIAAQRAPRRGPGVFALRTAKGSVRADDQASLGQVSGLFAY